MARILIDLPDEQVAALARIAKDDQRPRAAVIREAIDAYLAHCKQVAGDEVFGLWATRKVDGLDYQNALRAEW